MFQDIMTVPSGRLKTLRTVVSSVRVVDKVVWFFNMMHSHLGLIQKERKMFSYILLPRYMADFNV